MIFRKLIENPEFRAEFIQRMATRLNLSYTVANATSVLDGIRAELGADIGPAYQRWGSNASALDSEIDDVLEFVEGRDDYLWGNFEDYFDLDGTVPITIGTSPNSNGQVGLNASDIVAPPGYTGTYFRNVALRLRAIPDPGYRFVRWQETGDTDPIISITPTAARTLTPVFAAAQDLIINEIHYHPLESDGDGFEFVEIHNPDSQAKDLTGHSFSRGITFEFPDGTMIQPGGYMVIAKDQTN